MKTVFLAFAVSVVVAMHLPARSNSLAERASQTRAVPKSAALQGVWQAVEVTTTGPRGRVVKPQPNLTLFAAKHYSRTNIADERPRPLLPDPAKATAAQLRSAWGPFVAEAGSYDTRGNLLTMRPIIAKNAAAVGSKIVYSYQFEGETLLVTSVSDRTGAVRYPETIKLVRLE